VWIKASGVSADIRPRDERAMTPCTHEDLHLEEATEYRCANCEQAFVVLRLEPPRDAEPAEDAEPPRDAEPADEVPVVSQELDVSSQISVYLEGERRGPSRAGR
jgi:hypothetical protein